MAPSLPLQHLTCNVSRSELVSGYEQAQQGHGGRGDRTAHGRLQPACPPWGHPSQRVSVQEPTTPSGSSSPTGTSVRHRQIQSCSARDFISKTQVRDRTNAPTAQVTVAQDAWKEMPPPGDELQVPHTHQPDRRRPSRSSMPTMPGLLLPGRQRQGLSFPDWPQRTLGCGGHMTGSGRSAPSPQPSLGHASCRKLHLCRFPEHARSPVANTTSGQQAGGEGDYTVPPTSSICVTFS